MNEKILKALDCIEGKFLTEAATRKHRKRRLLIAVAAILALVLFWRIPSIPLAVSAKAVSLSSGSKIMKRPNVNSDKFDEWVDLRSEYRHYAENAVSPLLAFSEECSRAVLSGATDGNLLWSPVNAYIALAMTSELTGTHTQQELLDVLGAPDTQTLRTDIGGLWEMIYQDDGNEISILANSLWLDEKVNYHQASMDILSDHYYASVYQGTLGSEKTNRALRNWLNNETGGFLKNRTQNVKLSSDSMMALASTVYFQSKWVDEFAAAQNTEKMFHSDGGDVQCTFMNAKERQMNYYWGADFSAVSLWLKNDSKMWFILPDEDKTVDDVLSAGEYNKLFDAESGYETTNAKYMKVNLSIPKFDIGSSIDLKEGLKKIGLTDIFEPIGNDFSPSVDSEIPVYLKNIQQNTRVAIDEEGVVAASYIILDFGAGAAMPPEEIIDFVVDRPFLFAITTSHGIPLFLGTVQNPCK